MKIFLSSFRNNWRVPLSHMSEYSDGEETDESASLLPRKNGPTERAPSPYVNYAALPVTPKLTPTTQDTEYQQIDSENDDSSSIPSSESIAGFSFFGLPRKQKAILISVFMADFLSYLCLSLLAPFFPQEVSVKLHVKLHVYGT